MLSWVADCSLCVYSISKQNFYFANICLISGRRRISVYHLSCRLVHLYGSSSRLRWFSSIFARCKWFSTTLLPSLVSYYCYHAIYLTLTTTGWSLPYHQRSIPEGRRQRPLNTRDNLHKPRFTFWIARMLIYSFGKFFILPFVVSGNYCLISMNTIEAVIPYIDCVL